jgi:hypothetical protein
MTSFVLTGSVVSQKRVPVASFVTSQEFAVLGSIISLDGRLSSDPDSHSLTYTFGFVSVPIGSQIALEGFRTLDDLGAQVSFSPDLVGQYVVGLFVSNGVFESPMLTKTIDVRAILVPHARGLVPDGKFIWSYLRDVWTQVDGRDFFETLWSALIQICGADLLKLYQNDWNKSIRDIQDFYQRRWLSYEPQFSLSEDDVSFFLGNHSAGKGASTGALGESGLAVIVSKNELIVTQGAVRPDLAGKPFQILYSRSPENIGTYAISSTTAKQNGFRLSTSIPRNPTNLQEGVPSDVIIAGAVFLFDPQSTTWTTTDERHYDLVMSDIYGYPFYKSTRPSGLDDVRIGDVVVIPSGVNAGYYRIVDKSGGYIIVDRKPPAAGTADGVPAKVYRPVGFVIPAVETGFSDTITVPLSEASNLSQIAPGRVIVVNGNAYTIARSAVDTTQRVPVVMIAVEGKTVIPGQKALAWRVPHTLVSQTLDFESMGVRPGDTLLVSVVSDRGTSADIRLQVVGASKNRLGFVLSTDDLAEGEVPPLQNELLLTLSSKLGTYQAVELPNNSLAFSGDAQAIVTYLGSIFFKREFWNTELSSKTVFSAAGWGFSVVPRAIIRNRLIPIDASVRSIPALQEYISQPTILEENGQLYKIRGGARFSLDRRPVVVTERAHYVVDGDVAISGELTFRTGTDVVEADGGDFVDLGISPGDTFHIEAPLLLYGDYSVVQVLSRRKLRLSRPVPLYPLSDYVTGVVEVRRGLSGRFLRFIPGLFSSKNAAPKRLWAEVSFFDNSDNIERNFGLLVGLTKQELESVTTQSSYRQAVAGLMYAYVSGSAINKIRLGVSLLLGLPFTEKRGVIRSIENDYRLDGTGNPVLGRILIEDVDAQNVSLGVFRIYTFPIDTSSELAGVDTNPATKKPYQVGDVVEAFASLSKGVEIADFKIPFSGTRTAVQLLQQYHSARVRINDNIFQPNEVSLVSSFLRKITPSYIALTITNTSEFTDQVLISDKLAMRIRNSPGAGPVLLDTVGVSLPFGLSFDQRTYSGFFSLYWDFGAPLWLRRAGKDLVIDPDGTIRVPSGGLVNPRENESFEAPLCVPTDLLIIDGGLNDGSYVIGSLTDDTISVLNPDDGLVMETGKTGVHFAIARPMTLSIRTGEVSAVVAQSYHDSDTNHDYSLSLVTVEGGLRRDGVGVGDWFLAFFNNNASRHTIVALSQTGTSWNKLLVTPPIPDGVSYYGVCKPALFPTDGIFVTVLINDGHTISVSQFARAISEVGDELELDLPTGEQRFTILDPVNGFQLSPPPPEGTFAATLFKKRLGGSVLLDPPDGVIKDSARLTVIQQSAEVGVISGDTVTWSSFNPAMSGFRPGDFFNVLTNGANKTQDVGYGPGSYPIAQVSATTVKLTVALTNGSTQWSVTRRL